MDGVHLGADFLQDMEVIRYSTKRKSEITLSFTHETYEIICKNGKTGKVDLNGNKNTIVFDYIFVFCKDCQERQYNFYS